jgi:hypothetical protein
MRLAKTLRGLAGYPWVQQTGNVNTTTSFFFFFSFFFFSFYQYSNVS